MNGLPRSTLLPSAIGDLFRHVDVVGYASGGYTSTVLYISTEQGLFVVKRCSGQRFSRQLERAYKVLCALAPYSLLIPRPKHYFEIVSEGLESWLVMSHVPGETANSALSRLTDRDARLAIMRAYGKTLRDIHNTTIPPEVERWTRADRQTALQLTEKDLGLAMRDETLEILERIRYYQPPTIAPTFIHGDFTLRNTLVVGTQITGVIDWDWAGKGDPRSDIATAIRPTHEVVLTQQEIDAFYKGYGIHALSHSEVQYFTDLYRLI